MTPAIHRRTFLEDIDVQLAQPRLAFCPRQQAQQATFDPALSARRFFLDTILTQHITVFGYFIFSRILIPCR